MLKKFGIFDLMKIMKYMKPRALAYIVGLLGCSLTEASIVIVIPVTIKYMIDAAIKGEIALLHKGLILAVAEAVVVCVLFIGFIYLFWSTVNKTVTDIKIRMFKHVVGLPISYFEKSHSGDLISRLSNDVNVLSESYGWILQQILFVLFSGIGSFVLMIGLEWRFSIILMIVVVASAMINAKFSIKIRDASNVLQKVLAELTERTSDMLAGFTVMKMFHIEEVLRNKFFQKNTEVQSVTFSRAKTEALLDTYNYAISWVNFGGVIAVGALLAASGNVDLATVITEIILLGNVNFMIRNIGRLIAQMQGSLAGAVRVLELLEEKPEPDAWRAVQRSGTTSPDAWRAVQRSGTTSPDAYSEICGENSDKMLEMKDVSFAYDGLPVVNGISISLEKGKRAALVGGSGGGKSTVIKLLIGFYPVNSGIIAINGKSLGKYMLNELRSMIAYVPQDAYMFDGTVEENIRLGRTDASDEDVKKAAESAFAHEFIEEMPDGYKTVVGERGIRLSGGQRQRIAIARALLKDAPILLLDEATSSLDSQSEQKVQDAINRLMEGRTVLAVAHRLSTIEHSDIIYVIEDGKVTEQGKHTELLDKGETYSRLHSLQFSS